MTDAQIKYMVDRFLGWRLPEHFSPDSGISFNPEYNVEFNAARGHPPARHEPSGTNLFSAEQAMKMVLYMIEGMPVDESNLLRTARGVLAAADDGGIDFLCERISHLRDAVDEYG